MAVETTMSVTAAEKTVALYVGDLHPDVTDAVLFEAFKEFKSLTSVRVCRDSVTDRSFCYGYVNLVSPEDAIRAINVKNHSTLNGRVIRVMWSNRDPDVRKSGIGNVFVKNLSDAIDVAKLQEMFEKFGSIISCKIPTNADGKSKGHGFVQFESETSAITAIETLNGTTVEGKQMYVNKFVKKSDRAVPSSEEKYTNLYMKNLEADISEEALKEKLSKYGNILSLVLSKDEKGRGFGFVNFSSAEDAKLAKEALHGSKFGSKVLYVDKAQKKSDREEMLRRQREINQKCQASNLYVKNIDDDVTDDELRKLFSHCGTITSAIIMRDDRGMNKGFGFVCFSAPEEAHKAIYTFHGFMLHRKPLYVSMAQKKEDRRAQLQLLHAQPTQSAFIPGGYPHYYYPAASGVLPPGFMYQPPSGIRPAWRANGIAANPSRPGFQTPLMPLAPPNNQRHQRQNRGRMNGHNNVNLQGAAGPATNLQQPAHNSVALRDLSNRQHGGGHIKYAPNGRSIETNKGSLAPVFVQPEGSSEILSSLLAEAASPEQQKQKLGEWLYPLVSMQKPDVAAKITGMLLEMDNAELVALLDSAEQLTAKIEEAFKELQLAKSKESSSSSLQTNFFSSQVAVN